MRIDGDEETKKELLDLISHLTLPKLLVDWKQWFNTSDDEAETLASRKRIAPLLEKIDQQRSEINSFTWKLNNIKIELLAYNDVNEILTSPLV